MADEQIYESPRQRWYLIFFCVRPLLTVSPYCLCRCSELTQQHTMIRTFLGNLLNMLGLLGATPGGWLRAVLEIGSNVPLFTLTSRFVMNVRELYARDMEGRWRDDIDTGFGLSSGT